MQNKTWREAICGYIPFNEQEKTDKERFLKYLDMDNILIRENEEAHVSSSAWVMNAAMDQVLMAYHNIYQSYSWLGGHADGQSDLFAVALREAKEESGITELTPFSREILALDVLPVPAHTKHGKPVKAHDHLNVTYLFIAPPDQKLTVKADENSAVAWIAVEDLPQVVSEALMLPVYAKLIRRARQWKAEKRQGKDAEE